MISITVWAFSFNSLEECQENHILVSEYCMMVMQLQRLVIVKCKILISQVPYYPANEDSVSNSIANHFLVELLSASKETNVMNELLLKWFCLVLFSAKRKKGYICSDKPHATYLLSLSLFLYKKDLCQCLPV